MRAPLLCLLLAPLAALAEERPITARCTEAELRGKSAEELRLLRNEVYARRGREFKARDLQDYFSAQPWYRPDGKYSDKRLGPADQQCIALLGRLEKSAGGQRLAEVGKHHLEDVANIDQFGPLSEAALGALAKNGFVVVPAKDEQLFFVYEKNDYLNAPSLVTVDTVLQLYHVFFGTTLRRVEADQLVSRLKTLVSSLIESQGRLAASTEPRVRAAAERNLVHATVAAVLLDLKGKPLAAPLQKIVNEELGLIRAHAGRAPSPLFAEEIDYTQFIPRGHYTRSEKLRSFFMTMMWLGQTPLMVCEQDPVARRSGARDLPCGRDRLLQALLWRDTLRDDKAMKAWRGIYDITAFYVGKADELTPLDVIAVADEVFGKDPPAAYAAADKLERAAKLLAARFRPGIVQFVSGEKRDQPNARLMGQRYIPDSEILQRLSHFPKRPFPTGLDVLAGLGSSLAKELLLGRLAADRDWPEYRPSLEKVIADFARLTEAEWKQNLYYGWLWSLKALFDPAPKTAAPFLQTTAWMAKSLYTALASWTELRHDTILYAKQSGAECGGEEPPPPPKGYVEPNVAFYSRMLELLELSRAGLSRHHALDAEVGESFKRFADLCTFLRRVSQKELDGKALSNEEYEQIKYYGATLESLTLSLMDGSPSHWTEVTSPQDRYLALVADIHNSQGMVLEEAVGPAYEIYALVPKPGGGRQLARGSTLSHFEFTHPAADRLTDEKWQKMTREGKTPPPPVWTDQFLLGEPHKGEGKPVPYGSGC